MSMKRLNITLPDDVYYQLVTNVGKGKISSFIANIAKEHLENIQSYLAQCYKEASEDSERNEVINDWKITDGEDW